MTQTMNQQPLTSAPSLRFRRWSRKAYAPFASVGRHVTIGCVHKGIADRSLAKQMGTGIKAGCSEDGQALWSPCGGSPDDAPPDLCMTDIQELNMNEIRSSVRMDAYRKYFSAWTTYAHPPDLAGILLKSFPEEPAFFMPCPPTGPRQTLTPKRQCYDPERTEKPCPLRRTPHSR